MDSPKIDSRGWLAEQITELEAELVNLDGNITQVTLRKIDNADFMLAISDRAMKIRQILGMLKEILAQICMEFEVNINGMMEDK